MIDLHLNITRVNIYNVDLEFKVTVTKIHFQQVINQYCSINSSYTFNEKPISGDFTRRRRSATQF